MIPEREREALEHLTMCAREECSMCKYQGDCNFDFQYELATKNMNIIADALCKLSNSEKPNNFDKDINVRSKDEPKTQMKTQNSNLTFEKRTMRDCYNCKRYETEGECVECHYEPKDECVKEYEELGLKELKELIKADRKTEPSNSEKPNNYCDDCLYTNTCDSKEFFYACTSKATISKMEQVDEPQTDCAWR